jgi:hypothetical protein
MKQPPSGTGPGSPIAGQPEVERIFNLITLQLGNDVMLATKVKMREHDSHHALIRSINRIERDLKINFPQVKWSFFEPDLVD